MTVVRRRGRPRVNAAFDDWSNVQNKRDRKRIQDRLAQREKRIRAQSDRTGTCFTAITGVKVVDDHEGDIAQLTDRTEQFQNERSALAKYPIGASETTSEVTSPPSDICHSDCYSYQSSSNQSLKIPVCSNKLTCDDHLLGLPAWPIFAALKQHGLMQGIIPANCHSHEVSPLQPLSLPDALRPTPLQLVSPHRRWIDRFPFPRLRDNLIVLDDLVDLDEFVRDLFATAGLSFRFELRRPTWEPSSWEIKPDFASKWGYLFY